MNVKKIACIIFITASFAWGCNQGGAEKEASGNQQAPKKEQVQAPKQQQTTDKHGRKPGDAHYGHDHSHNEPHNNTKVNTQQPAAPANGEPDQYGRKPGDPHYGHGHP